MFEQATNKSQFVIVYDKLTKPIAKYLSNSLAGKYDVVVWSKKIFLDNEAKLKNSNKVIFFDEDLIEENLSLAEKSEPIIEGALFIIHGNMAGLKIDSNYELEMLKKIVKKNWIFLIMGGLNSVLLLYFFKNEAKKAIRLGILHLAAKKFIDSYIDSFMNGTGN